MKLLKVCSDSGKVITYINMNSCFAIKSDSREENRLIFKGNNEQESFTFTSKEALNNYVRELEKLFETAIIKVKDDEDEPPEPVKDILDSDYDPMDAVREKED